MHVVKSCNIEGMQSATAQGWSSQPGRILVRGWAYDSIQNTVPGVVRVQLSSADGAVALLSQAATRVERLDVANHFKDTRLSPSGFEAVLDASRLPPASYHVAVTQFSSKTHMLCLSHHILQIK